ncbi:deoxyribose-phosphate aldolase [Corynebacterium sp.]|uniref:deoxyribose-phosphate aldolase n=1 Tax=Corynebacterium sp. TaxID=1720 RepID=UPI0026DB6DA6|nr:deoxyribose-phosphate aldolase [Corynebacterium sp.]MDO5031914.1 deoxyribose-phosphate aldolase [Corynebacterium sp.]
MEFLLDASAQQVRERCPGATVVVSPHHVTAAAAAGAERIISVAGYPTGRHHSLIKASEARLAVQSGAAEVWVAVDALLDSATSLLSELITIREACPPPVRLGLITAQPQQAQVAEKAGYDVIVAPAGTQDAQGAEGALGSSLPVVRLPSAHLPIVRGHSSD